nr:MAG: ORF1 [Torque teno midi virus]
MPFWWRRRRRFWWGRRRYNNPYRKYKTRKQRRRRIPKRRTRRTYRRRRRRRYKVRRKRKLINLKQWQPDSIRKCKIIGLGVLVLGAEGKQMDCFTTNKYDYIPPKVPYGGGFGVEKYTLSYLYAENLLHNNIWTTSNIHRDLCRYLRCKIIFYRHPETDFIVAYQRQGPFDLNKYTYPGTHPHQLLLEKHHRLILSQKSVKNGKYKVKMNIKPPKQMITKWFFQKNFAPATLFLLKGAAMNLRYSFLSASNENLLVSLLSINPGFYKNLDWAQARSGTNFYEPYTHIDKNLQYKYKVKGSADPKTGNMQAATQNYKASVNYNTGYFMKQFLNATEILQSGTHQATIPLIGGRYNPIQDDGQGNKVYVKSILQDSWEPPTTDKTLLIEDMPLWLSVYGIVSYLRTMKNKEYLKTSVIILISKHIYCAAQIGGCTKYIPIDYDYTQGQKPYDQLLFPSDKEYWYPTVLWQLKTLNAIAESGPYMPKYSEEKYSTWELKYKYIFYFKWGGSHVPEDDPKNPADQATFDVPDTVTKRLQIANPETQATETFIHPWDYRRGSIKPSALKRMYSHLESDADIPCSQTEIQKKKIKYGAALQNPQEETQEIQKCLQELCKESTYQESTETVRDLIKQQHHQQQQLKYNIIRLLIDLKEQQKNLQLQTGFLS